MQLPTVSAKAARVAMRLLPPASVLFVFVQLARGGFSTGAAATVGEWLLLALLAAGVGLSIYRRAKRRELGSPMVLRDELELGGGLIAAAFAGVALGGPAFFPVVYLLVAFLVTFLSRSAALTLLGTALLFDAVMTLGVDPWGFAAHVAFLVLFAGLYHAVLSSRLAAAHRAERLAVAKRIKEVEERARTFRLVHSGTQDSSPGVTDQEKWLMASVKEIEGALGSALEIAETALGAHTCAAFLLSTDDRTLKLHDCRSASELVRRERFEAGEGLLGGVLKRGVPVRMHAAAGLKGVTFYEAGGPNIQSVLAVPIAEASGHVRGVLVADRVRDEPFSEQDERLLSTVANEVLRSIEVERVMGYIRKTRDEKDKFFRAIEEMNRANSPDQVFVAVLEGARQIASVDFCAVTLVSEEDGRRVHRITRISGVAAHGRALEGRTFSDNNGLVANVVRYGTALPGRDVRAMDRQMIFDADIQVRGLSALKIFPLVAGERVLGTLVAGSRKKSGEESGIGSVARGTGGSMDDDTLRMLEVIAIQAAQAVLRAQLYEQMERMATTDGLTGLLNHRTFQAKADEALAQAKRYGRNCSLILTDIDHFKSVNDTYGHPTGDLVLRGVAKLLRQQARDADVVARYGGEEFVLVMPETDVQGAQVIAERIREAVQAEVFQTENGPLKVTLSLGIAGFPGDSEEKQGLIDLADQCLYFAKRNGRNQSVTVAQKDRGAAGRKLQVAVDG